MGSQHTILFHVDDLKCSHRKKTVNNDFAEWLEKTYGQHGKVKLQQAKVHDYPRMKLDYSEKKKLKFDMRDYVKGMLGCLQPSLISLFYFLFSSNQIALFFLENRIHLVTPLQKSYC